MLLTKEQLSYITKRSKNSKESMNTSKGFACIIDVCHHLTCEELINLHNIEVNKQVKEHKWV